jgi:hypothetical protein
MSDREIWDGAEGAALDAFLAWGERYGWGEGPGEVPSRVVDDEEERRRGKWREAVARRTGEDHDYIDP